MKKIYTLAAASLVAGIAYASAADVKVTELTDRSVKAEMAEAIAPDYVPQKKEVTRADDYKSIGEGMARDFIFSSLLRGFDPYEFTYELEQSESDPHQYRIPNLYNQFVAELFQGQLFIVDDSQTNYIYITTFEKEGKTYWYMPDESDLGFFVDGEQLGIESGEAFMFQNIIALVNKYDLDTVFDNYPDGFGILEDGVFTMPKFFIANDGTKYTNILWNTTGMEGYFGGNTNGQLAFGLPGVELPAPPDPFENYTLVGECEMQNNVLENLFGEESIAPAKVEVYEEPGNKGYFHIRNAYLAGAWNNPEEAQTTDFEIDLTNPTFGVMLYQATNYTDVEFGEIYIESASAVYTLYAPEEQLMTKDQFLANEQGRAMNIYIDEATKRIIIPPLAVWYEMPELPETDPLYHQVFDATAMEPKLEPRESWIQLPKDYVLPSGIGSVVADDVNAPVKYYNLQGMELKAPEAGQLVIMKKGAKTSKMIAK